MKHKTTQCTNGTNRHAQCAQRTSKSETILSFILCWRKYGQKEAVFKLLQAVAPLLDGVTSIRQPADREDVLGSQQMVKCLVMKEIPMKT